jgi:hypothetical protein
MGHPVAHSDKSVQLWGGKREDYLPIHDWLDDTKQTFADFRHRALRHHSYGIFEAEQKFGHVIVNSDGKEVPVRYICEQHIREDCGGIIPSVQDWLKSIKPEPWMNRPHRINVAEGKGDK